MPKRTDANKTRDEWSEQEIVREIAFEDFKIGNRATDQEIVDRLNIKKIKLNDIRASAAYFAEMGRLKDIAANTRDSVTIASIKERKQSLTSILRGEPGRDGVIPQPKDRIAAIRELNAMDQLHNGGDSGEKLIIVMPAAAKSVEEWMASTESARALGQS